MGVEFLHLPFLSVILDKQLIKMIGALWLAGAQRNNFLTHLFHTLYVCGILYQMKLLMHQILTFLIKIK